MNSWEPLLRAALLGTHREPSVHDLDQTPVTEMLDRLPKNRPAHWLLSAAGTIDLYEQIGRDPERTMRDAPRQLLPPAERTLCNAQATYYMSRMLSGPFRNLLPEFLEALLQTGHRVPDILMPNLLAHGARTVAVRPFIIPLLSQHDRQLAANNPAWSYASPDMDSWAGSRRIWDSLPVVSRLSLIKQLRASTPELGRELLESTWKLDPDNERLRIFKALQIGLSMKDEPFLETALDDRSQLIRRQAAELLAFLPESRLSQRMADRVKRFLVWTPNQEQQISVRFPAITPVMIRDGVVGSKSKSLARVRAQQLIQMVSAVPLTYWTTEWHNSIQTILQSVIITNWTRTLFAGFTWAAYRQKDTAWAKEIVWIRGLEGGTHKLVDLLASEDYSQLLRHTVQQESGHEPMERRSPLVTALHRRTHPFDAQLTKFLLPLFASHFKQDQEKRSAGSLVRSSFLKIARTCPTELSAFAAAHFADLDEIAPQWQSTVAEFLNILVFRRKMLEAVNGEE